MDITSTLEAKSSQLNTDDLIAGAKTIKITKVSAGSAEQPVAVSFEGDGEKPWYPCKSMRRVLVAAWGADASQYVGRRVTLFRDPSVIYGGIAVGGIRVSHLSDLDGPLSIALTVTRQKRSLYKVQPLPASPPAPAKPALPAKPAPPASPAEDVIQAAAAACRRSGLTSAGIAAFVLELTQGNTSALSDAPPEALAKIVRLGVSPQTVKRCNAEPEADPQAPNSEAPPSSPNLAAHSGPNLGPSSLTLEPTSGPEQHAPATEPGTVERLPEGGTIVASTTAPAPAAGRRSAPALVRRSAPAAAPAAEAPIPGLVD
jgi:hypothetical protein